MDGPTTLADTLLEDLDDLDDLEDPVEEEEVAVSTTDTPNDANSFLQQPKLVKHLENLDSSHDSLVLSTSYLAKILDEIQELHYKLQKAYGPKFPELPTVLPDVFLYAKTVRALFDKEKLEGVLSGNQVLTVTVAASTSIGRELREDEQQHVQALLDQHQALLDLQTKLQNHVQSELKDSARNLVTLLDSSLLAARLVGLTGGLQQLVQIPSCNVQTLGRVPPSRQGILQECHWVQNVPKKLQPKVLKWVAAKVVLAARCDCSGGDARHMVEELRTKIEKLQEPEKARTLKALPKPDLTTKKRRGGKRMRRLKARFEETAMMKQANTRAFSEQVGEYGDDAMGLTRGLLDTKNYASDTLRKRTDKKKMTFANTKASRKRAAKMKASANTSGLASSVAFGPTQGMELINPDAQKERVKQANSKWFSETSGFQSALPKK